MSKSNLTCEDPPGARAESSKFLINIRLIIHFSCFSLHLSPAHQNPQNTEMAMAMALSSTPHILSPYCPTPHSLLSHTSLSSLPKTATTLSAFSTSLALPKSPSNSRRIKCVERASSASSADPTSGIAVYKPKSYEVLVTDAARSLAYALEDGKTRLEIDFP